MSGSNAPRGWFQLSLKTILLLVAGIGIYLAARYPHDASPRKSKLLETALRVGDRANYYGSSNHGGTRLVVSELGNYEVVAIGDDFVQVKSATKDRYIPLAMIASVERAIPQPPSAPGTTASVATAPGSSRYPPMTVLATAREDSPHARIAEMLIARYDKDGDRVISAVELSGAVPASFAKQADENEDGELSEDELVAYFQSRSDPARSSRSFRGWAPAENPFDE